MQVYQQALTASQVSALYTLGRLRRHSPANKLTTTWTLDQRGLPTSMTDPDGNVTYYGYDQAGRLAETNGPDGDHPDRRRHPRVHLAGHDDRVRHVRRAGGELGPERERDRHRL